MNRSDRTENARESGKTRSPASELIWFPTASCFEKYKNQNEMPRITKKHKKFAAKIKKSGKQHAMQAIYRVPWTAFSLDVAFSLSFILPGAYFGEMLESRPVQNPSLEVLSRGIEPETSRAQSQNLKNADTGYRTRDSTNAGQEICQLGHEFMSCFDETWV